MYIHIDMNHGGNHCSLKTYHSLSLGIVYHQGGRPFSWTHLMQLTFDTSEKHLITLFNKERVVVRYVPIRDNSPHTKHT